MPRQSYGKDWERASYVLDKETKDQIKEVSTFEGMSQSGLISFLVKNWDAGINPSEKLNNLLVDRKKINNQLQEIDNKIEETTNQIKQFDEWKKIKSQKKGQALRIIKRKIMEKDFEGTERVSKFWQRATGIPAIELISEAAQQIKETGI